nr:MAG TPA: hypothetical protein [Caudoviricetes sp.]
MSCLNYFPYMFFIFALFIQRLNHRAITYLLLLKSSSYLLYKLYFSLSTFLEDFCNLLYIYRAVNTVANVEEYYSILSTCSFATLYYIGLGNEGRICCTCRSNLTSLRIYIRELNTVLFQQLCKFSHCSY